MWLAMIIKLDIYLSTNNNNSNLSSQELKRLVWYQGLYFKEVWLKPGGVVHELVDGVIDHPEVGVVPALLRLGHPAPGRQFVSSAQIID